MSTIRTFIDTYELDRIGLDKYILLGLWLFCTAFNLEKAFHIDDAFHLEAAQWIAAHPAEPMSAYINWEDSPTQMIYSNHPPLYFYLIAAVGSIFGFTEGALHSLGAIFTGAAIWLFYQLVVTLSFHHRRFLTCFFALSPAFVLNQNLMLDVPLLTFLLATAYFLLVLPCRQLLCNGLLAGVCLSAALLTKYTALPMLGVVGAYSVVRRSFALSAAVVVPLLVLVGWSWYTYTAYGVVHLLSRREETHGFDFSGIGDRFLSLSACLGAVSPYSFIFFERYLPSEKLLVKLFYAASVLLSLFVIATCVEWLPQELSKEVLRYLFLVNGIGLVGITLHELYDKWTERSGDSMTHSSWFFFLWVVAFSGFIILMAPFVATRHILLLLAPIALMHNVQLDSISLRLKVFALGVTVLLSTLLAISDREYAAFYKNAAQAFSRHFAQTSATVWGVGHWGWQWYSQAVGMPLYHVGSSRVQVGDWLVYPLKVSRQALPDSLHLQVKYLYTQPPTWHTFFATHHEASFYNSTYKKPDWRLSLTPIDTVVAVQVVGIEKKIIK